MGLWPLFVFFGLTLLMSRTNIEPRKIEPLKGYDGFKNVLNQGEKFHSQNLFCSVEFSTDNKKLAFGVGIGKKIAKKAVVRNRVKRLLRESIRKAAKENIIPSEIDKLVLLRKSAPLHPAQIQLSDIYPEFLDILEKIKAYLNKQ